MRKFTVKEAALATLGHLEGGGEDNYITGVTMDSRKVEKGFLFVAIKGERVDGHDFINDVFEKGAAAVLCDHVPDGVTGPCIVVKNTVKALQDLAEWYRLSLDIKVVGITGSVGKTSTKEVVSAVLAAKYRVQKTLGNYNNEIGLPLTVLATEPDTEILVLEMGISDFGEMRVLSKVAHPDICVITNIGQCHLEFLHDRDGILRAKSEIFEYMNPKGSIYLNGDDDKLITLKNVNGIVPTFFGFSNTNEAYPKSMESLGLKGSKMHLALKDTEFDAIINIPGRHMVLNATAAAAIGHDLAMTDNEIIEGLNRAKTISGRSNIIESRYGCVIDDCYNASPASMKSAIDTLCLGIGKKLAILGDMFELGEKSDEMHAEVGEYAVSKEIDKLICVGENCKHMYDAAVKAGSKVTISYFATLDEFLNVFEQEINGYDNILLKSSHGMEFSKIIDIIK